MIWLFKNGEGKVFNEDEVREKMAGGWALKRDRKVADALEDEEAKRFEDIKQSVSLVLEAGVPKDINANGYPDVRAVEKLLGFDITPEERDSAYQSLMGIGGN